MRIQQNVGKDNHEKLFASLINESERSVLCSGWLKYSGLKLLLPSIDSAISQGAQIVVYSNEQHTELEAVDALASRPTLKHVIASGAHRYLHTKLFYFEKGENYTAVIGSANVTEGGLVNNEELSIIFTGIKSDSTHKQFEDYLLALPTALRRASRTSVA
jgi:HKD family nuclease